MPHAIKGQPPPGTRLYAVGDIHGRLDLLIRLQAMILEDADRAQAPRNVIVYLGDYIDRGPESQGVIERLIAQPLPGFQSIHLMGNHEAALVDFLDDLSVGPHWLGFGGDATLASYGIAPPAQPRNPILMLHTQNAVLARLPNHHLRWLEALPLSYCEGGVMLVHAGIRPGVPLDRQDRQDLLWIREPFLNSTVDHPKLIVHGHTISSLPDLQENRVGIDTGAVYSGRLTALALQAGQYRILQT